MIISRNEIFGHLFSPAGLQIQTINEEASIDSQQHGIVGMDISEHEQNIPILTDMIAVSGSNLQTITNA